jgi:hypothetical protein
MKTHQALEQIFKFSHIPSKAGITGFMRRIISIGKFDEPKQNAVFDLLLNKVADLEEIVEKQIISIGFLENDVKALQGKPAKIKITNGSIQNVPFTDPEGLKNIPLPTDVKTDTVEQKPTEEPATVVTPQERTTVGDSSDVNPELKEMKWKDLVDMGNSLKVYQVGMNRETLERMVSLKQNEMAPAALAQ